VVVSGARDVRDPKLVDTALGFPSLSPSAAAAAARTFSFHAVKREPKTNKNYNNNGKRKTNGFPAKSLSSCFPSRRTRIPIQTNKFNIPFIYDRQSCSQVEKVNERCVCVCVVYTAVRNLRTKRDISVGATVKKRTDKNLCHRIRNLRFRHFSRNDSQTRDVEMIIILPCRIKIAKQTSIRTCL